jgi:hypothetical protein
VGAINRSGLPALASQHPVHVQLNAYVQLASPLSFLSCPLWLVYGRAAHDAAVSPSGLSTSTGSAPHDFRQYWQLASYSLRPARVWGEMLLDSAVQVQAVMGACAWLLNNRE